MRAVFIDGFGIFYILTTFSTFSRASENEIQNGVTGQNSANKGVTGFARLVIFAD